MWESVEAEPWFKVHKMEFFLGNTGDVNSHRFYGKHIWDFMLFKDWARIHVFYKKTIFCFQFVSIFNFLNITLKTLLWDFFNFYYFISFNCLSSKV